MEKYMYLARKGFAKAHEHSNLTPFESKLDP